MEVYLDNAATTKIDRKVIDEIIKFNEGHYANPSSQYKIAKEVKEKIDEARKKIAKYINADSEEIIFTSGATESNNFAIKGLTLAHPEKKHIVVSCIEHPSIINTCKVLEKKGYEVDYIRVNEDGIVDISEIKKKIRKDTLVVSVMWVNNEIGTIQPIKEIGEICKEKEVYFHSDIVQGFKKIPLNVKELNVDLLSVSGHKFNAPKGIGFLYIKLGTRIKRFVDGGEQEFKLRAGTENILGIIGLSKALDLDLEIERVKKNRDYILERLKEIKKIKINGSIEKRIYNNINVSFYGIEGESLMLLLDKDSIYVSTGSACSSYNLEESYVLRAINVDELYTHGSIRISLDKDIDKEKADYFIEKLKEHVDYLRKISPFKIKDEE
ncbi:MAG: cysteine desulfurase family protein [Candidatus Pacearchaeota archaeon]